MDSNNRHNRTGAARLSVLTFAVLLVAIVILAFVTTLDRVEVKTAHVDQPPGTIGLAHPHPPLQRAPDEPAR
jgi:hypothetical protein